MDLVFCFLLLRDLARTFRALAATIVGVFILVVEMPLNEMYFIKREIGGVLLQCPQPAVLGVLLGIASELVLGVQRLLNPKLFEIALGEEPPD